MGKNIKKSLAPENFCRAEADEVKHMMLLNAFNESEREENDDASNLKNGESEKP